MNIHYITLLWIISLCRLSAMEEWEKELLQPLTSSQQKTFQNQLQKLPKKLEEYQKSLKQYDDIIKLADQLSGLEKMIGTDIPERDDFIQRITGIQKKLKSDYAAAKEFLTIQDQEYQRLNAGQNKTKLDLETVIEINKTIEQRMNGNRWGLSSDQDKIQQLLNAPQDFQRLRFELLRIFGMVPREMAEKDKAIGKYMQAIQSSIQTINRVLGTLYLNPSWLPDEQKNQVKALLESQLADFKKGFEEVQKSYDILQHFKKGQKAFDTIEQATNLIEFLSLAIEEAQNKIWRIEGSWEPLFLKKDAENIMREYKEVQQEIAEAQQQEDIPQSPPVNFPVTPVLTAPSSSSQPFAAPSSNTGSGTDDLRGSLERLSTLLGELNLQLS